MRSFLVTTYRLGREFTVSADRYETKGEWTVFSYTSGDEEVVPMRVRSSQIVAIQDVTVA